MNEHRIPTTAELDAMVTGPVYDTAPDKGVRPKLSTRRVVAYGVAAGAVLGGGLMGWSHYQQAEADRVLAERRVALEERRVEVEAEAARSVVTEADKAREEAVMDCVDRGKSEGGFGSSTADVIERCSQAFPSSVAFNDTDLAAAEGSGSVDLGGGVLVALVVVGAVVFAKRRAQSVSD
ncbi:hypothetical protein [Streptomyces sp. UH6]|uniref:hypothetical protein n=1 Tax=Streptomyces sp. UH6 TaxID=2748379 RepID=UPI0015D4C05F|nr:hypothetical protein [Streptomyces sp. UH6]NYV73485.1 hypothetical protein [Streptomyces sp. UH6]